MSDQDTNQTTGTSADDRVQRAQQRRARDEQWLAQAKRGDADAYRQLVDEWAPIAFDRAMHRGADERRAADVTVHAFTALQSQLTDDDVSFGSRVMGVIEHDVPVRPRSLGKVNRGAKRAAERLTRGTDPVALGADPSVGVMVWDAIDVLGDRARDITDLHYRHGLAADEIAAATGETVVRVDDVVRKAPQGLAAALRTRLLWAGGKPDHDDLTRDLKSNNVRQFDSTAVRVIHAHLRACSVCRSRSLIALPAIDIFANIPLVGVPADVERRISGTSWAPFAAGVAGVAAAAAAVADPMSAGPVEPEVEPLAAARPSTPVDTAPLDSAPLDTAPLDTAPLDTAPLDTAPLDTVPLVETTPLEPTPSEPEVEPAAARHHATATAAAGAAGAAALMGATAEAAGAAAPSADLTAPVMEPPAADPLPHVEPPVPDPDPFAPMAGESASPLAALARTPTPASPPAPSGPSEPATTSESATTPGGSSHAPVASRASERESGRPKWLIPAGIAAAVVLLAGVVVGLTRGGGDTTTALDAGAVEQSTTTTRTPTSSTPTSAAPPITVAPTAPTTQAPSTSAPVTPTTGNSTPSTPFTPPTTRPVSVVANVQYSMSPGTIRAADAGSRFEWSVSANGPITVEVTGPGVSSSAPTGGQTVCSPGSSCGVGTHYFTIVAKDAEGRQVGAGTAKLIVRD